MLLHSIRQKIRKELIPFFANEKMKSEKNSDFFFKTTSYGFHGIECQIKQIGTFCYLTVFGKHRFNQIEDILVNYLQELDYISGEPEKMETLACSTVSINPSLRNEIVEYEKYGYCFTPNEEGVEKCISQIKYEYLNYIKPFLMRYNSLQSVDFLLNNPPEKYKELSAFIVPHVARFVKIIVAMLVGNPNIADIYTSMLRSIEEGFVEYPEYIELHSKILEKLYSDLKKM